MLAACKRCTKTALSLYWRDNARFAVTSSGVSAYLFVEFVHVSRDDTGLRTGNAEVLEKAEVLLPLHVPVYEQQKKGCDDELPHGVSEVHGYSKSAPLRARKCVVPSR